MKDEKPERLKNRLAKQGADHLSTEELLTILFEKNCVTNLLTTFDNNVKEIFSASIEELMKVKGIGFARACKIQVIFELIKRILSYRKEDHPQIESTDDVIMLLATESTDDVIMLLKRKSSNCLVPQVPWRSWNIWLSTILHSTDKWKNT